MNLVQWIEIFAMVTGLAYVVLEILQKNAMWVVGVLTGAACAVSFAIQHSWGMMSLNIYYVFISFVGLVRWRRDGAAVEEWDSLLFSGPSEMRFRLLTPWPRS